MKGIVPTIGLPPRQTVDFFRAKSEYPISDRWWEVWQEEHARAFTVAGITDRMVLEQVRYTLDTVLAKGGTFADWKGRVLPSLRAALESGTAPLSILSDNRLETIYYTNLRMARAAGQWVRIQSLKEFAPYLMYVAIDDGVTRPLHRQWGGLDSGKPIILPIGHPFWRWFFPPNGWGCRCQVIQLSEFDIKSRGLKITTDDELRAMGLPTSETGDDLEGVNTVDFIRGDGAIERVPVGVDPGFAYNVGEAHMRGLSPRPLDRDVIEPLIIGDDPKAFPPFPKPQQLPAASLLSQDVDGGEAALRFLAEFGATMDKAALFTDAVGQPVIIDSAMVTDQAGRIKSGKFGRGQYALLAARALKSPDEIWSVWNVPPAEALEKGARAGIVRRYLATFDVDGESETVVVIVEIGSEGWTGKTWFPPKRGKSKNALADYLDNKVRGGVLQYRRADKEKGGAL